MRVLLIGAAGRVGRVLTRELTGKHDLLLADCTPLPDPRFVPLDVLDVQRARQVVPDCDAAIFLSIVDGPSAGGGNSLQYAEAAFDVQVKGVYNVLRAAADAGRTRVLYASSLSAVSAYPEGEFITSGHRHRGGGVYGITKGIGEDLCRQAHEERGLSVTILRLGYFYQVATPLRHVVKPHIMVHELDVADAFRRVLTQPNPPYSLLHIVSDSPRRTWDIETARDLYGWRPRFSFGDDHLPFETETSMPGE